MEALDYWRVCEQLSVVQAVLLILGVDPAPVTTLMGIEQFRPDAANQIVGYEAVFAALTHGIRANRLPARLRFTARDNGHVSPPEPNEKAVVDGPENRIVFKIDPNWHKTTVSVEDLKAWLTKRGLTHGFFFPDKAHSSAKYLDPKGEHYANKLAAAVSAWEAVAGDPTATRGKSPKQAITNWLTTHRARFGLAKSDGSPNEQGIEEVAKVANWEPRGGAPKTPGQ